MTITQDSTQMIVDTKSFWSKITGSRQIILQKGGNTTVHGTGFFGKQLEPVVFPTNTITAVRLMTYFDNQAGLSNPNNAGPFTMSGANDQNNRRSRLVLQLSNNDQVEIASKQSSTGFSVNGMNMSGLLQKAPLSQEAQQIAGFLGVPLNAADSSSFGGIISGSTGTPEPKSQPPQTPPTPPAPLS